MKPVDVNSGTYIDFEVESNDKDPIFKVNYLVKISKYKNISAKGYIRNQINEVFVIIKVKNTVPWKYVIEDLKNEEIVKTFYEKNYKKIKQSFELKKQAREKVVNYISI